MRLTPKLTDEQRDALKANIELCRDAIVFFYRYGSRQGRWWPYRWPLRHCPRGDDSGCPVSGQWRKVCAHLFLMRPVHRVATQYLMAALNGDLPAEQLMKYRVAHEKLPGHPELGLTPGVKFSSGRLGHMWPYVNGVALANPGKNRFLFGV